MTRRNITRLKTLVISCVLTSVMICPRVWGQPNRAALPLDDPRLLRDDTALICEAGGLIGGGNVANAAEQFDQQPQPSRREVILEFVARVDANRDRHLEHNELLTLDFETRQRLLKQFDTNLDRKLSDQEIQQALAAAEIQPAGYPYTQSTSPESPAEPKTFRNVRRYGIGLQQATPPPRRQPFARAAVFGSSPGFRPPRQKDAIGPPRSGSCQRPSSATFDIYLRVR